MVDGLDATTVQQALTGHGKECGAWRTGGARWPTRIVISKSASFLESLTWFPTET